MAKGVVTWFSRKKGFGFIASEETGADVFVHLGEVVGEGASTLAEGDRVEFETEELYQRLRAKRVQKLNLTPSAE